MSGRRGDRDRHESLVDLRKALGRCARLPWLGAGVGHRRLVKKKGRIQDCHVSVCTSIIAENCFLDDDVA